MAHQAGIIRGLEEAILEREASLHAAAKATSDLDAAMSLASVAADFGFVRPEASRPSCLVLCCVSRLSRNQSKAIVASVRRHSRGILSVIFSGCLTTRAKHESFLCLVLFAENGRERDQCPSLP